MRCSRGLGSLGLASACCNTVVCNEAKRFPVHKINGQDPKHKAVGFPSQPGFNLLAAQLETLAPGKCAPLETFGSPVGCVCMLGGWTRTGESAPSKEGKVLLA